MEILESQKSSFSIFLVLKGWRTPILKNICEQLLLKKGVSHLWYINVKKWLHVLDSMGVVREMRISPPPFTDLWIVGARERKPRWKKKVLWFCFSLIFCIYVAKKFYFENTRFFYKQRFFNSTSVLLNFLMNWGSNVA